MTWQNRLNKAWDYWKVILHGQYGQRIELHHIYGRIGIFKSCPLLIEPLTKKEHNDYILLKAFKEDYLQLKEKVLDNYIRHDCCQKIISQACLNCPMLRRDNVDMCNDD